MSWRTVIVSDISKLDLQAGFLVSRSASRPDIKVILSEIDILIIENCAVSISGPLLVELTRRKVRVILCDEQRNPCGEFQPYYGSHDSSLHIQDQLDWSKDIKLSVWQAIVIAKIQRQARLLEVLGKKRVVDILYRFASEVEPGDPNNREAQAARVYFPILFGPEFIRDNPDNINAALNYGYSIILSTFNRIVTIMGYMTQCGIFHTGNLNPFNFGCDLMEPWRPFVDRVVYEMQNELLDGFGKEQKRKLVDFLHTKIKIRDSEQTVINGIEIYSRSVVAALQSENTANIILPELC